MPDTPERILERQVCNVSMTRTDGIVVKAAAHTTEHGVRWWAVVEHEGTKATSGGVVLLAEVPHGEVEDDYVCGRIDTEIARLTRKIVATLAIG